MRSKRLDLVYPLDPELTQLALDAENCWDTHLPCCTADSDDAPHGGKFHCTRDKGHTGPHVAHAFDAVVYAWREDVPAVAPNPSSAPIPPVEPSQSLQAVPSLAQTPALVAAIAAAIAPYDVPQDIIERFWTVLNEWGFPNSVETVRMLRATAAMLESTDVQEAARAEYAARHTFTPRYDLLVMEPLGGKH